MGSSEQQDGGHRRWIPVINNTFQWKYTLLVVGLGVGVSSVMGGLLLQAHNANTELLVLEPALQHEVMKGDQLFMIYLVGGVIFLGLVLLLWGLIVTHRISGPLFIVGRYLSTLGSGKYPDLRPLRKKDELKEFFRVFEDGLNGLRDRDQRHLNQLEQALAEIDNPTLVLEKLNIVRDELANRLGQNHPSDVA
jgi:hypothetical protein